jgi:hypothetical protein
MNPMQSPNVGVGGKDFGGREDVDAAYKKFTKTRKTKHGYNVKCSKGLWSITAPTKDQAIREGKHYFIQYYMDGEYI